MTGYVSRIRKLTLCTLCLFAVCASSCVPSASCSAPSTPYHLRMIGKQPFPDVPILQLYFSYWPKAVYIITPVARSTQVAVQDTGRIQLL
jgi:hypothetical protein